MKTIKYVLAAVILFGLIAPYPANAQSSFRDVKGHWASEAIGWAVSKGIVSGYSDQTFKPNKQVTQAEFLTMSFRLMKDSFPVKPQAGDQHWSDPYYRASAEYGITIWGGERREKVISRGEVAQILVSFVDRNYWGTYFLLYTGISKQGTYEAFREGDTLTRAEAVQFLYNFNHWRAQIYSKPLPETPSNTRAEDYFNLLSNTLLPITNELTLAGEPFEETQVPVKKSHLRVELSSKGDITYYKGAVDDLYYDGRVTTYDSTPIQTAWLRTTKNGEIISDKSTRRYILNDQFILYETETLNYENSFDSVSFTTEAELLNRQTKQVYSLKFIEQANEELEHDFHFTTVLSIYELVDTDVTEEYLDLYFGAKKGTVKQHEFTKTVPEVFGLYPNPSPLSRRFDAPILFMYNNKPQLHVYELFAQFLEPQWNQHSHSAIMFGAEILEPEDQIGHLQKHILLEPFRRSSNAVFQSLFDK